jgi:hypothetical protein
MAPYGRSVLARWLEAAPPPPPYLYPSRGGLAFVFLVSWLAGTAATYCRARQKPAGRLSIGLSTRPWNEESRAATFLNPGAPHAAGNRE